ncbi:uncharacterized protein BDZ99DRAFT_462121 [Mytilinidion resinicola]|uniref:SPX domain-containing protein n=1 Tax=Mytilinidion resinicola TaxID=574789 RepID=A0A6A6YPX4_9PEZI|nr:uncharacterized protein BDZ99DRAFT_462121 [Mytilinidion resinicola]KAF2810801.1 hypothetical protein BDZ99DRAFT_462121 [Mytilinidion resinicola]
MRFGRNLHRHRIPEWASSYLDYGGLKRRLKLAVRDAAGRPSKPDLTDFFAAVVRESNKVEAFYQHQHGLVQTKQQAF